MGWTDLYFASIPSPPEEGRCSRNRSLHGRHPLVIKARLGALVKITLCMFLRENILAEGWGWGAQGPVLGWAQRRLPCCEGSLQAGGQVQGWSLRAEQPLVSSSDDSEAKFRERYKHSSRSANTARQSRSHARPSRPPPPPPPHRPGSTGLSGALLSGRLQTPATSVLSGVTSGKT